ncbi:MAG: ATP-dependent sacrificial sulfur transferase LarE [Aigarchaeota archaeon]|nr:ATP-dependent sacrificial sulfur transferase LarE [Aigarchaeota archaeon]
MDRAINWFKNYNSVIVAFSGGVDSSVVAALAKMALGDRAYAVTGISFSVPEDEVKEAEELARLIGINHLTVQTDEFENEMYLRNMPDRCYHCKIELSDKLLKLKEELGVDIIVDGTNADDVKGHRPGYQAVKEHGIRSPLLELGIGKQKVREIASYLKLPVADKPASACLSSRVMYGQRIEVEDLLKISKAESLIKRLSGAKLVRVRLHGNLARIEVGKDERKLLFNEQLLDEITRELTNLGFAYVTLDLSGYESGSMLRPFIIPKRVQS